jgi:two-component system OmpR family response regulator
MLAEWSYMTNCTCRITTLDELGRPYVADVQKGDLWYFPRRSAAFAAEARPGWLRIPHLFRRRQSFGVHFPSRDRMVINKSPRCRTLKHECPMRILLIEDDIETASLVSDSLTKHGNQVEVALDGSNGLKKAATGAFDVLVVDRMLPDLDGLSLVQSLRRADVRSAVLFLTAVGGIEDRIEGFDSGADDYLVKPFALGELIARVSALGRRPPGPKQEFLYKVDDMEVNLLKHEVRRGGEIIHLQPREYRMLKILLENRGRVVTRSMILEQMWGLETDAKSSIVQTNVSRLRLKIDRPGDTPLIRTVRGLGYIIDPES